MKVGLTGEMAAGARYTGPVSPNDLSQPSEIPGRVAGIDYGTVRIGIALSDPRRTIASPYENYTRRDPTADAARFRRLAADEGVTLFVVGLPVHLDGSESAKSVEARRFAEWLAETTGVPVELFDERFSSSQAEQLLLDADMPRKARKKRMDKLAAQIVLAAYLDSGQASRGDPGALDDRP